MRLETNTIGELLLLYLEEVLEKRLVLEFLLISDAQVADDCEH